MTPIAPHLTAFLRERLPLQGGASAHTCDSYAYAFQLLLQFASARLRVTPSALCLEQLDAPLVMDFLQHLETTRHNSPRTRNARLVAIKTFMRFLEHRVPALLEQSRRILAIPAKRTDTRLISYLSLEEMQAVLNAPNLHHRDGIRDRAMLHLCFAAGSRVAELVSLPLHALEWQPSPQVCIHGKGHREWLLPLWKQTAVDLRAWLAVRGQPPVPELFVNARDQDQTDDPRGLRVCPPQARHRGGCPVSVAHDQARLTACPATHGGDGGAASHRGYPQGLSVARAYGYPNNRDLSAG